MKKLSVVLASSVLALALSGCGHRVEVGPGQVGKEITEDGYVDGYHKTSVFRLGVNLFGPDHKLVILDAQDKKYTETYDLLMPKDRVNLKFVTKFTLSVNPEKYDTFFNRLKVKYGDEDPRVGTISSEKAFEAYARPIIRSKTREIMARFTIDEITMNPEKINAVLNKELSESVLEQTPYALVYIGLTDYMPPKSIVARYTAAREAEEEEAVQVANRKSKQAQFETEKDAAEKDRIIRMKRARTEVEINNMLSKSLTPDYVRYKQLEIMSEMARSDNKVFIPVEMLDSISAQNMMSQ